MFQKICTINKTFPQLSLQGMLIKGWLSATIAPSPIAKHNKSSGLSINYFTILALTNQLNFSREFQPRFCCAFLQFFSCMQLMNF